MLLDCFNSDSSSVIVCWLITVLAGLVIAKLSLMFLFSPTEEKKALDKFEEHCVQTMLFKLSSRSQTDSRFLSSGYAEAASTSRQYLSLGFQHRPS